MNLPTVNIEPPQAVETITPFQTPMPPTEGLAATLSRTAPELTKIHEDVRQTEKEAGLADAYRQITRLRQAASQNRITYQDARGRVTALLKEQINAMPHRAQELRQHAANFFGAYGEGWGALNEMADEQAASSMEQKLMLDHMKRYQAATGLYWGDITPGMQKEAYVRMQVEKEAELATNLEKFNQIDRDNGMRVISTQLMPLRMALGDSISLEYNSFKLGQTTLGEMQASGASHMDIIDALAKNDVARKDLEGRLRSKLDYSIQAAGNAFDKKVAALQAKGIVFDAATVKTQREAFLAPLTNVKNTIGQEGDSQLATYVGMLQSKNSGTTEAMYQSNPTMAFMKAAGMLDGQVMQQYLTNPKSISPAMHPWFDKLIAQQHELEYLNDNIQHLKLSPWDLAGYERSNKPLKKVLEYSSVKDLDKIIRNGKFNNEEQKQWFFMNSHIYLQSVDPNNTDHLADMKNKFTDPRYATLYKELPEEQQNQLSELMNNKLMVEVTNPQTGPLVQLQKEITSKGEKGRGQNVAVYYDEGEKKIKAMVVSSDPYSSMKPQSFADPQMKQLNDYLELLADTTPMKGRDGDIRKRVAEQLLSGLGSLGNTDWTPEQGLNKLQSANPLTKE